MKKVVLMLWGVCITLSCYTQETNSLFPVSDVNYCHHWSYSGDGSGLHANHFASFTYELSNTLYEKDGKTYQMVTSHGDRMEKCPFPIDHSRRDMIGIREEGGRVYINQLEYMALLNISPWNLVGDKNYIPYEKTADGELVIYDYNMQVGDRYPYIEGYDVVSVTNVETLTTQDAVCRRLLTLSNGYKLLEGIGCLNSPGMFFFYLNPLVWEYYDKARLTMWGYSNNDPYSAESLFDNGDKNTSVLEQMVQHHIPIGNVFDLEGRYLAAPPKKGVYIENGRKRVAK